MEGLLYLVVHIQGIAVGFWCAWWLYRVNEVHRRKEKNDGS